MNKKPTELVKEWRERADMLLKKDQDDVPGQLFLKLANDLDLALKSNNRKLIAAVLLAASPFVLSEALLPSIHEWQSNPTYATLAAPLEFTQTSTDHTEHEGEEQLSVSVASAAVSGANADSHTVISSALLSLESGRRVERPFVFSSDSDYAILSPLPRDTDTIDSAKAESDMQKNPAQDFA